MRSVEICGTREQLADLAPSWDSLDTYLHAPFTTYQWILSCADTLADDSQLFIPVIRKLRVPVAMAPLVKPHGFLAAVRQLGVEDHREPGDFGYEDIEALDLLVTRLAESHVPLALTRVPTASPVLGALRRAYRRRGVVLVRPRANCPFIEIDASEDQTSAGLPASLRSDLRRASRKAEQIGVVSVETHSPSTEGDLLPLWDVLLKVEAAGWKGRSQTALLFDHRLETFYRSYAVRACEQGILRVLLLKIGPDIASIMVAVEASERFWILKIGYDEQFAKCSPGMLLMHEALRYAARQGLRSYEFLGSATEWTRRWTDCERSTHAVFVYPYTVQGAAIFVSHSGGFLWREVRRRVKDHS